MRRERKMAKDLPQEVINDILLRLSIKDLLKFRCVSKFWLHLLSIDPHFQKSHLQIQQKKLQSNPSIIAMGLEQNQIYYSDDYTSCNSAKTIQLQFNDSSTDGNYLIFGICNGLICLSKHTQSMFEKSFSNVHIFNPLTKDHVTVPCTVDLDLSTVFGFGLNGPTVFGFGFNEKRNEYKVIRMIRSRMVDVSYVCVYTLGTKSWRALDNISCYVSRHGSCAPLVNGALHWITAEPQSLTSPEKILCFDINDEVFREMIPPEYPRNLKVGELGGMLSVYGDFGDKTVHVWVMKEYGVTESWIKQFIIREAAVSVFDCFEPLGLVSNHEVILRRGFHGLFLYNSFTDSITKLEEFNEYFYAAFTYCGSFVSPKSYHIRVFPCSCEELLSYLKSIHPCWTSSLATPVLSPRPLTVSDCQKISAICGAK